MEEEDKGGPDDRLGLNIVNDWCEEGWGRLLSLSLLTNSFSPDTCKHCYNRSTDLLLFILVFFALTYLKDFLTL